MKNYRITLLLVFMSLLLSSCSRYIKVNHGDYISIIERSYKGADTHFFPFLRSTDTICTGYKTVYAAIDLKAGGYVFDTIPFCNKDGKPSLSSIYEVYYYKGQPRFTKEIGIFAEKEFRHTNRTIIDINNWKKQIELGLQQEVPTLAIKPPKLSDKLEMDTTQYTKDDIEYMLRGKVLRNSVSYGISDYDSLFLYLRKDGFTVLSARPDYIQIKHPDKGSEKIVFWKTDFLRDLSQLPVSANENVSAMFDLIPDSLLNSKSCEFPFDTITYKKLDSQIIPGHYYKEYINIKFKDGNYKIWSYYKFVKEEYNTLNKYPCIRKFIDDIDFLYFLPSSNYAEYIDPDFTLGNTCHPNSVKLE